MRTQRIGPLITLGVGALAVYVLFSTHQPTAFAQQSGSGVDLSHTLPEKVQPWPSHRQERSPKQITQFQDEASKLQGLANDIVSESRKVTKDDAPADLESKLKEIEKLSKQLRKDLSH